MKYKLYIVVFLFGVTMAFVGNIFINLFSLWAGLGYYIPVESNLHSFEAIQMNTGSGEWWLYAEDENNYYAISDNNHYEYLILDKSSIPDNFVSTDKTTWGDEITIGVATP